MRKILFILVAGLMLVSLTAPAATLPVSFDPIQPAAKTPKELAREAVQALKDMPRKERKAKLKQAKKELRDFKAARKRGEEVDTNLLLLVLLALILPPVAVYLHEGTTNNRFWITLLLFVLGISGIFIFGWWAILASIVYALIIVLGGA
jgi:uncharacterized membrane protein YqaE (UPF0057 family)